MRMTAANRWGAVAGGAILVAGLMVAGAGAASASTSTCRQAGDSGFTAKVVAHAGQTISRRTIDASGCDVGIYVDAPHVTISRVTVTNANDAGILAFDTHDVTITRSTVTGNGFSAPPAGPHSGPPANGDLPQAFAISIFGVSRSVVTRNQVYDNGRGGIGVMDDGPFGPGRVVGGPGFPQAAVPVHNVVVSYNYLKANYNGCAIVVSAFNSDNTVRNVAITGNVVTGTGFGPTGPDVGGIVAQSNGTGSMVENIVISGNIVTRSGEGGVIVHAQAAGSHTKNVRITRNVLAANNQLFGPPPTEVDNTAGVIVSVIGAPGGQTNINTIVSRNVIVEQFYGVWTHGDNPPTVSRNLIWVPKGGHRYFQAP